MKTLPEVTDHDSELDMSETQYLKQLDDKRKRMLVWLRGFKKKKAAEARQTAGRRSDLPEVLNGRR